MKMAYEKTTWTTGDVVTAEKLNKIEDGVAAATSATSAIIEITTEGNRKTLNATYNQLVSLFESGCIVCTHEKTISGSPTAEGYNETNDYNQISRLTHTTDEYGHTYLAFVNSMTFSSVNPDNNMTYTSS